MSDKAILDGKKVVPIEDTLEWARWYETASRRVGFTRLSKSRRRRNYVLTVFLGMDHGYTERLWFETMIFGTSLNQYQERYATWEEAERGHALAVGRARLARQLRNPMKNRRRFRRDTRKLIKSMKKLERARVFAAKPAASGPPGLFLVE